MSKISLAANIKATTRPGMTPERAVSAAKDDLAYLSNIMGQDPQTPAMREIGYRLISIGQYLATQGRPR